jgi:8-oxo-dGTP pyrophosphatase MutT (NUDIX family)
MLQGILNGYMQLFGSEQDALKRLAAQVTAGEVLNDRRNFNGHITSSAVILSPDKKQVLLIYHKLFQVWQQPGGHWEADESDPLSAAKREAVEETGVHVATSLSVDPAQPLIPLDIDTHEVPARPAKDEPVHYHYDFRYVLVAADTSVQHQAEEVDAAKWFALDDPATKRIERCISKLHSFKFA